jgi:hypothetical protein
MKDSEGLFPFRLAWMIPVGAAVTLTLGIWYWLSHRAPIDEALYRGISLFEIDSNAYTHDEALHDWRIRIGRWTGAGVVISSLLAVAALLHEHITTAIARWTKQAVVVVGSDPLAQAGFEAARQTRRSVLWLGSQAFGSSGFSAISLAWPPHDHARAVVDHAGGADHVLIAEADDADALALARAARKAAPGAYITLLMRDMRLAEESAATLNEARTRVMSTAAIAARALAVEHPPFLIARELGHRRIHAVILGFGQTGQSIARDLIVNCRTTYLEIPRITVIDPQAKALEGVMRVRAPEIDACAEFSFIEGEISGRAVRPDPDEIAKDLGAGGPITAAYVCLATDIEALSAASMLQSLLRAVDIAAPPTFVRLREVDTVARREGGGLDALIPFGDLESVLEASEFLSAAPDATAREFCEAYRASLAPERRDDPNNRSAFPWDTLDETYRQVTRELVAHIPAKLASVGIDPARWRGQASVPQLAPGERLFCDAAQLEALSWLEHERWNASRRMDGWRYADLPSKDAARKLHQSLVPYEALTDEVKEYDRVMVRQTQVAVTASPGA